jgi:hypothetical protein
MYIDGYVGLSHYSFFYLNCLPIDIFNILLFLYVNIINSGLNKIVKRGLFLSSISFNFHIFVILPDVLLYLSDTYRIHWDVSS